MLNEEERLPATLASVAFCDEVIVVDSGSTDRTRDIARAAGATVVENPWPGFGAQRNVAIDHATGDWILEVDADERVTPELRADIQRWLALPPPEDVLCCVIGTRHRFLGRALGPAAKYPSYRVRLFRRGVYRHDEARKVHEGLWARERTWALRGYLDHVLAGSWREALRDAWAYARLEAQHMDRPRSYAVAIVARPAAKFGYRVVVDGGWRDGPLGIAKIALDCMADGLAFVHRALGPRPEVAREFGRIVLRTGPVRICWVGPPDVAWLEAASAAGADVALVTDRPRDVDGGTWLHVQPVEPGVFGTVRALNTVGQIRPVDLLVWPRPRLLRLLSPSARGALPPRPPGADAPALVRDIERATR